MAWRVNCTHTRARNLPIKTVGEWGGGGVCYLHTTLTVVFSAPGFRGNTLTVIHQATARPTAGSVMY